MNVTTLTAFLAVDLLLVVTPGADWAFAIAAGLGERSVVPAVAGLVAGYAGYTLLAVAGLVVLVASLPGLLTVLTVLGAVYLMWLGFTVLIRPLALSAAAEPAGSARRQTMLRGVAISGLNPKALLLYFAVFPQFIDLGAGWPVAAQTGLFGLLHMASCGAVYLTVGLLARSVLKARPAAGRAVTRVSGAVMILIGGFLLVQRLIG